MFTRLMMACLALFAFAPTSNAQPTMPYTGAWEMNFGTSTVTNLGGNFAPGWTAFNSPDLCIINCFGIGHNDLVGAGLWHNSSAPFDGENTVLSLSGFAPGATYQMDLSASFLNTTSGNWGVSNNTTTFGVQLTGATGTSTTIVLNDVNGNNTNVWVPWSFQFTPSASTVSFNFGGAVANPVRDFARVGIDGFQPITFVSHPCYGAGAPFATEAEWMAADWIDSDGFLPPDCDGDGIDDECEEVAEEAKVPEGTCPDPEPGNPCVPNPYATLIAWQAAGSPAFADCAPDPDTGCPTGTVPGTWPDCDGDGSLPCPPAPLDCDDDNSNPCIPVPHLSVTAFNAAVADGSQVPFADLDLAQPDCDGDGDPQCGFNGVFPPNCDPDDGDACVTIANPTPSGSFPDCDGDGVENCDLNGNVLPCETSEEDENPCVPNPYATLQDYIDAGSPNFKDCTPPEGEKCPDTSPPSAVAPDCDGDGEFPCPPATAPDCDPDNSNPCVPYPYATIVAYNAAAAANPAIDPSIPDCDGDGYGNCDIDPAAQPCDTDDGDPCNPVPIAGCEDPLPQLSSKDQSLAAMRAFGSIMRHVEYRLETSGQEHDGYLMQYTFENEDRGLGQGGRWTAFGLSSTELDGQLSGDGLFVYGLAGWDMAENENNLWGFVLGAEYGDWAYVGEGAAQKLGISAGIYGGQLMGDRLQVTGYLTYTHFFNEFENTLGQTANMQSDRLIGAISINGKIGESGGLTVKPFLDAQYAIERYNDYTYSGGGASYGGGTASVGEIGLGAEINLPFNESWGSAFVRIEANKTFGDDAITLSNGTVLTPNDDVTGSLGLGWVTNTSYDSIGRLELSVNDIGNDARQEIRFDGHWERNF